jgi:hypothetical protein
MDACSSPARELPMCIAGREGIGDRTVGLEILPAGHPYRASLQQFIADTYLCAYGARIQHFAQYLVGLRRSGSGWSAGVGYTLAGPESLFVEQYLEKPIEAEMAAHIGVPIRREQIVEVGNLAASGTGAARQIIVRMTALLHLLCRSWVVFTSTKALLNSFARLDISPILIARADPRRLPDGGESWGSYYDSEPCVMAANIPLGYVHLFSGNHAPRAM